ncbi:MAG: hypothetical protein JSW62_01320 [Thermoplasmatales archaeon]|nr:MAG: hypothetical protein JSW62_01320 [Thermoplasmatales archaeon]
MTKRLRAVKASIVMGILLVSLFVAFTTSSSAYEQDLMFYYNAEDTQKGVKPLDPPMFIHIWIKHKISGLFPIVLKIFEDKVDIGVDLEVGPTEPWVTVTLTHYNLYAKIDSTGEWLRVGGEDAKYYAKVSFTEDAPAITEVKIPITIRANAFSFFIPEKTINTEISFSPQFIPIFDITPSDTFIEVGPGDIANFDLEIENMGNGKTEIIFEVEDLPEGWTASVVSNAFVGAPRSGNNKKVVPLQITPPYNFGYHNTQKDIVIKATGRYFGESGEANASAAVKSYLYRFTVRSKGFSTPGFEIPSAIMAFALIAIALMIKKQQKKK